MKLFSQFAVENLTGKHCGFGKVEKYLIKIYDKAETKKKRSFRSVRPEMLSPAMLWCKSI